MCAGRGVGMSVVGVELFAGGGGLALGLEQAGVKGLAYVEIDKDACETLRQNRPDWNVIEGDIARNKYRFCLKLVQR